LQASSHNLIAVLQLERGQLVGASLLAMAVGQAMNALAGLTPSLAGKLPTGLMC
jgi:hypothetical protein